MLRPVFLSAFLSVAGLAQAAVPDLMPMPAKVETGTGKLAINATFGVAGGAAGPLAPAVERFLGRVARQTGIFLAPSGSAATLRIACAPCTASPALGEDESYQLDVTPTGANLKGTTVAGALHGLETFLQLIQPGPDGFQVPAVHIDDRPRIDWRGLMRSEERRVGKECRSRW